MISTNINSTVKTKIPPDVATYATYKNAQEIELLESPTPPTVLIRAKQGGNEEEGERGSGRVEGNLLTSGFQSYTPAPIELPPEFKKQPQVLCLDLFEYTPDAITIDLHPEYLSTQLSQESATTYQAPLYLIQHHHVHTAACMAENGIPLNTPPTLDTNLDGLGYNQDDTIWNEEFLLSDYSQLQRLATSEPVAMIGGEMVGKGINSPPTSSGGCLLDAGCSYKAQAAIEFINSQEPKETLIYSFVPNILDNLYIIDLYPIWQDLLNDLKQ